MSHWPGSESVPLGSKDEVVKVEVKEEKQEKEKPPVQILEKDAAIFPFENKVLHMCKKFLHTLFILFGRRKETTKMHCMRMSEWYFCLDRPRHWNPAARSQ